MYMNYKKKNNTWR